MNDKSWETQAVDEIIAAEEQEYKPPIHCPNCGTDLCFEVEEVWLVRFNRLVAMKDATYCPHCGWEAENE